MGKDVQNLMDHFDNLCARICVSFADEKKKGPTKKLHYYGLLFADKKLYLLIACTNSKHKSHSESDYGILVKRRCGGGVDSKKGFPAFLTDRMRVSISH